MNLIPCTLCCLHQKEGYCSLAMVPQGRGDVTEGECLYFSPAAPHPSIWAASPTERTPTSSKPSSERGAMR